jgi:hypothetical protein
LKSVKRKLTKKNPQGQLYYQSRADATLPIRWQPPEALRDNLHSRKADVWAFGVTLWEIWTNGLIPYQGWSNAVVIVQVCIHFLTRIFY